MKPWRLFLAVAVVVATAAIVGCSQTAPAPTAAPAAPTKPPAAPAQPTTASAPAAQPPAAPAAPTAAPAAKVTFPEKGRTLQIIVPFAAGGGSDIGARALTPFLERELGIPVEVVNKGGAGSQIGLTELAKSKPDGYTIGFTNLPTSLPTYMDPERKAVYSRKDFAPIVVQGVDPGTFVVKADGPWKTLKDLIDAAKANPNTIKGTTAGILTSAHLEMLEVERLTGAKFTPVHFTGDPEGFAAVLGDHADFTATQVVAPLGPMKAGQMRVLGVMDTEESKFMPGVKTFDAQGYKVLMDNARIISAPAGTPKEVMDVLSGTMKKIMNDPDYKKKMDDLGVALRWMDPAELSTYWDNYEKRVGPLIELGKKS